MLGAERWRWTGETSGGRRRSWCGEAEGIVLNDDRMSAAAQRHCGGVSNPSATASYASVPSRAHRRSSAVDDACCSHSFTCVVYPDSATIERKPVRETTPARCLSTIVQRRGASRITG